MCCGYIELSCSSWTPVECGPPFENVGAFCSDFIPTDNRSYGSKQFQIFDLHFEIFVKYFIWTEGLNFRGSIYIMTAKAIDT